MNRLFLLSLLLLSQLSFGLELKSSQFSEHGFLSKTQEFQGFGCDGQNRSPDLSWSDIPEGTKGFAITVYDPDAPTGSGWWHWLVYNLPAETQSLAAGAGTRAGNGGKLPAGASQGTNDYGVKAFGGACPPKGHGVHHYQFTVYALKVDKLDIPENASAALIGYMLNANSIDKTTVTALYQR